MNGIIIQQTNLTELESSIRKIVREELLCLDFSAQILKLPKDNDEPLLSKGDSAKLLGISLPTFSKMIKDGKIKPFRIGKRFKFKKTQILSSINTK